MGSAPDSREKPGENLYNADPLLYGDLHKGQFPSQKQTLSNTDSSLRDSSLLKET